MRMVEWTDEGGYNHKALVRDGDPDDVAKLGMGLSQDPPPVDALDWEMVKRELHNQLLAHGITGWDDIRTGNNKMFGSALIKALKTAVITWLKGMAK